MDYRLSKTGIRLTYLQDKRALARIDWVEVLEDLSDAGAPPNRLLWSHLDALTHVVLAASRKTGRVAGVLGLVERVTSLEPYLLIDAIMVRPDQEAVLPLAMLAHTLSRVICLDGKPPALAARRGDRATEPALRGLAAAVSNVTAYPPLEGNVIALSTASLARRIGTAYAALDLRSAARKTLLRDLQRLHRARVERQVPKVTPKLATTGGATRRPRTTTRTGSSV